MADVEEKLEQRHIQTAELISYTNEVIGMLTKSTGDSSLGEVRRLSETRTNVAEKIEKVKNTTKATKETLTGNIEQMNVNCTTALEHLQHLLSANSTDTVALRQSVADVRKQAEQREREGEELQREHRRVKSSKVQRRLQRAIVDVNFDLLSTEQNVRGFIKNAASSKDIQTFDIDYVVEDPCDVADRLWDMAC